MSQAAVNFLQDIIDRIDNSGQVNYDNGWPEIRVVPALPQKVGAQYQQKTDGTDPELHISASKVEDAMRTGHLFELVNSIVHEKRHFDQDCVGALSRHEQSLEHAMLTTVLAEADAYTHTAQVMDAFMNDPEHQDLAVGVEHASSLSGQVQAIYNQAKEACEAEGLKAEQMLSRSLLYGSGGSFAYQYLTPALKERAENLHHFQGIADTNPDARHFATGPVTWPQLHPDAVTPYEINDFYSETGFFDGDDGTHDHITSNDFIKDITGEQAYPHIEHMVADVKAAHRRLHGYFVPPAADVGDENVLANS